MTKQASFNRKIMKNQVLELIIDVWIINFILDFICGVHKICFVRLLECRCGSGF